MCKMVMSLSFIQVKLSMFLNNMFIEKEKMEERILSSRAT